MEFDRAIDVLLAAPGGARTEPRLREQFDRLVDRISALEVATLAEGDGFSEKPSEPASIDALFDLAPAVEESPTAALTATVETDLALTSHDIPIPLNARVLSYVELFQGRLRGFIQEGLDRGSDYLPMIQSVFRAEGLPLDLAYVPLIESAFKTNALSRASAKGVWQFMRPTAMENGLKHDWYVDERSDPHKATRAAAKYLKTLGRMFDGDWHLALASYNGGPGRVQRAMKRYGRDDFWSLSSNPRWLPRETREYVPMILAAVIIARNPAQYGFTVPESRDVGGRREGHRGWAGRSAPRGRVDVHAGGCHPAAQSGTPAMDDAGARPGLRAESAARQRPRRCAPGWTRPTRPNAAPSTGTPSGRAKASRPSLASCA